MTTPDESPVVPVWGDVGVPEDDSAEPEDAEVTHELEEEEGEQ